MLVEECLGEEKQGGVAEGVWRTARFTVKRVYLVLMTSVLKELLIAPIFAECCLCVAGATIKLLTLCNTASARSQVETDLVCWENVCE